MWHTQCVHHCCCSTQTHAQATLDLQVELVTQPALWRYMLWFRHVVLLMLKLHLRPGNVKLTSGLQGKTRNDANIVFQRPPLTVGETHVMGALEFCATSFG